MGDKELIALTILILHFSIQIFYGSRQNRMKIRAKNSSQLFVWKSIWKHNLKLTCGFRWEVLTCEFSPNFIEMAEKSKCKKMSPFKNHRSQKGYNQ